MAELNADVDQWWHGAAEASLGRDEALGERAEEQRAGVMFRPAFFGHF